MRDVHLFSLEDCQNSDSPSIHIHVDSRHLLYQDPALCGLYDKPHFFVVYSSVNSLVGSLTPPEIKKRQILMSCYSPDEMRKKKGKGVVSYSYTLDHDLPSLKPHPTAYIF